MEKIIIVLTGVSEGKTKFTELIKAQTEESGDAKYWTWQINTRNVVGKTVEFITEEPPIRDKKYYDYINKRIELDNEYWNFEYNHYLKMIKRFMEKETPRRPVVLIIHGCSPEHSIMLQEQFDNCFSVHITDKTPYIGDNQFTVVLNNSDLDYEKNILDTMELLKAQVEDKKPESEVSNIIVDKEEINEG
jgi:hypothetical protein